MDFCKFYSLDLGSHQIFWLWHLVDNRGPFWVLHCFESVLNSFLLSKQNQYCLRISLQGPWILSVSKVIYPQGHLSLLNFCTNIRSYLMALLYLICVTIYQWPCQSSKSCNDYQGYNPTPNLSFLE